MIWTLRVAANALEPPDNATQPGAPPDRPYYTSPPVLGGKLHLHGLNLKSVEFVDLLLGV